MSKQVVGQVAIQQAMIKELGLTYRKVAQILKVNHRTVWQHVAAKTGSKVRAWEKRTTEQREKAVLVAKWLLGRYEDQQAQKIEDAKWQLQTLSDEFDTIWDDGLA